MVIRYISDIEINVFHFKSYTYTLHLRLSFHLFMASELLNNQYKKILGGIMKLIKTTLLVLLTTTSAFSSEPETSNTYEYAISGAVFVASTLTGLGGATMKLNAEEELSVAKHAFEREKAIIKIANNEKIGDEASLKLANTSRDLGENKGFFIGPAERNELMKYYNISKDDIAKATNTKGFEYNRKVLKRLNYEGAKAMVSVSKFIRNAGIIGATGAIGYRFLNSPNIDNNDETREGKEISDLTQNGTIKANSQGANGL